MQMRQRIVLSLLVPATAIASAQPAFVVDCSKGESLQNVVEWVFPNTRLLIKGTCTGPITITTNGLQLNGGGTATINGNGSDAITVDGAQRVLIKGLNITGGGNGVVANNNAQVTLTSDAISGNTVNGVYVTANSSVTATSGSTTGNINGGVDAENSSSFLVTGPYQVANNVVFGLFINNGATLRITGANLSVSGSFVGVQVGTTSAGFEDANSVFNASNNFFLGLTVVSGAHMADFGGVIKTDQNGLYGIDIASKAGLDLDAASQVESNENLSDGVQLSQNSVMTIFNNPQFSGNPATTTLTTHGNAGNGINLLSNSMMEIDNYAEIQSTGNTLAGITADNGSSFTFAQTLPGPFTGVESTVTGNHPDVALTFGSRLSTVSNDNLGSTHSCDATVLVRGPVALTCPH
jgi:hypothetical protein